MFFNVFYLQINVFNIYDFYAAGSYTWITAQMRH